MIRLACAFIFCAAPVAAETLVAVRTIPARTIINAEDVLLRDIDVFGGITDTAGVVGQETRVALYAGRPIRTGDIGPPSVVERNQIVTLVYSRGGIVISTEGRALDRASAGDLIRVMNITSRATVTAQIDESGTAFVAQ